MRRRALPSPHDLRPTVVILIDANALAIGNMVLEPGRDDFGHGIVQALDVIEQAVIELPQQRLHNGIDLGEVAHEAARAPRSTIVTR